MAHDCFEDQEVADKMNSMFINVKVDREERPDVDAIYMDSVQALTGRGGWPMTVFCTPEGEPFYGGTYFPKESFLKLMDAIDDVWKNKQSDVRQNVEALLEVIGRTNKIEPVAHADFSELIQSTVGELQKNFDTTWGGFGKAPKFPSTFAIDLLIREHCRVQDPLLRVMAETSLDAMAAGGIYDHLGGGFARYSVDDIWLVPHFEKMLYDQALLVRAYLHAWQEFSEERHLQVVKETVAYVLSQMTHSDGGFYSAEDADSLNDLGHSEEGAFYTWTTSEVRDVLGDDAGLALDWWGITEDGNFEGRSIPHRLRERGNIARSSTIEKLRQELFAYRSSRPRPGLDNKVLLEWNAMFLSSLCEVALATQDAHIKSAALKNAHFLVQYMRYPNGFWARSWQSDASPQAQHNAISHDLAHLIDAMTRMYELTQDSYWISIATSVAEQLIDEFWDPINGGLFTVGNSSEELVVRQKDLMDNATASANSAGALALIRLSQLTKDEKWEDYARRILLLLARVHASAPSAFCNAMIAASCFTTTDRDE